LLVACGGDGDSQTPTPTAGVGLPSPTVDASEPATNAPLASPPSDAQEPITSTGLGAIDNRSLAAPARDTIFSCNAQALGPALDRPWVDAQGVIDYDAKPSVAGVESWENEIEIALGDSARTISTNGLPDHITGSYPAAQGSEAFSYDPNPNVIDVQQLVLNIPAEPKIAVEPSCLSFGPIAIALSGAVIFNALDADVRDAVANEVFDVCEGHPARGGVYHYHHYSPCWDQGAENEHSPLVGYGLDGFGMYGPRDADGTLIPNDELDECHGHTGPVPDGGPGGDNAYHYHATEAFPYTLGCYRGELR
jgi:hypothetical protein